MSKQFVFADWPPTVTKSQLEALTRYATTYALSHGLLLFEQAKRIQRTYNVLYSRIAMDEDFLDEVMGAETGVGKVDEFIGQLWKGWKQLRDTGLVQPLQLGLFRSDYLLHSVGEEMSLKQVEFNTISISFGCLSQRVAELHRYLYSATRFYDSSPHLTLESFPTNESIAGLAEGLKMAHKAYGVEGSQILFVVQPGERNVFDQRWLEYELLEKHSIRIIRQTFDELANSAVVDFNTSVLHVKVHSDLMVSGLVEISTVYYRSGYVPSEYPTAAHYTTRFLLERSKAIKCPSIALQLAGGKKVQEVLTQPGVLERFLCDEKKYGSNIFSLKDVDELRSTFMGMWGLDIGENVLKPDAPSITSGNESFGVLIAREKALSLVLKPQREGGGNNVYKEEIYAFLDELPTGERQAWIAMELIQVPEGFGNYLIRAGSTGEETQNALKTEVVSELGIFGWALFGGATKEVQEREVGWLVRTKGKDSNEGGVATGFSVLDSLLLVD
ncbi:hypothetical protein BDQ17DRAFT_1368246 [Cyathus striatus]|nr:hypothetical protein BDQ17DRAFT_1368246 [Cyathus striatus]